MKLKMKMMYCCKPQAAIYTVPNSSGINRYPDRTPVSAGAKPKEAGAGKATMRSKSSRNAHSFSLPFFSSFFLLLFLLPLSVHIQPSKTERHLLIDKYSIHTEQRALIGI